MKRLIIAALAVAAVLVVAGSALAASIVGPIGFDSYAEADINGQQEWSKTGAYDVAVVDTSRLGFGKALRISNATTSGAFGDQTFSPAVAPATSQFNSSFRIATTQDTQQPGLAISVSPDNGQGARMSYLRFEDQVNGIHVFFSEARGETFKERDIATLTRSQAHTIAFAIDLTAGAGKAVKVTIDDKVAATGATWASYYRVTEGNPTPTISKMLFRAGGTAAAGTLGQGFLIDNVQLSSS